MTKEEMQHIQDTIESESFDYVFCDYSDFKQIKDDKFHELRLAYINAKENLESYIY